VKSKKKKQKLSYKIEEHHPAIVWKRWQWSKNPQFSPLLLIHFFKFIWHSFCCNGEGKIKKNLKPQHIYTHNDHEYEYDKDNDSY